VSLVWNYINTTSTDFVYGTLVFTSTNTTDIRIRAFLQSETNGVAYVDALSVRQAGTLIDSSGNSNNGAVYGASSTGNDGGEWGGQSNARFSTGSALQFDGVSDYVDAANAETLNNFGTGGITVEAWVYAAGSQSKDFPAIVEKSTGDISICGAGTKGFWLLAPRLKAGSQINWGIANGNGDCLSVTSVRSEDELIWKWHHIVGTADDQSISNPALKLYFDGTLSNVRDIDFSGSIDADTVNLNIGRWRQSLRYFNGIIDEVRLYNRALSADEVLTHYQRRMYASPDALASVDIPFVPTMGTPTVLSSNSIRWNFTDNADHETGFRVYDNTDTIATSSTITDLTYLDETDLYENTQYTRYVKAYNSYGESASSSATSTYTLADPPEILSQTDITSQSIAMTVDSFPNDASASSGYQFSNLTRGTTSGWIQDNTWQESNLSCPTTYTYSVKYRNGDGVETTPLTASFTTQGCSGYSPLPFQIYFQTSPETSSTISGTTTTPPTAATTTVSLSTSTPNSDSTSTSQIKQASIQQLQNQIADVRQQITTLLIQLIQIVREQILDLQQQMPRLQFSQ